MPSTNQNDGFDEYRTFGLRSQKVPVTLHHLIPVAEQWGISDDRARDAYVEYASKEQLEQLVQTLSNTDEAVIDDWLSGPELYSDEKLSEEFVTFVNLTLAYDLAIWRLKNWKGEN